ncbi:MAG: non-heme iron oxygenase ferredoxin subunit [Dehalococcoidia bacterium]|jgi:3-phenylpropionate/trans-cinnamate dioxygenase ferredoxin subunit
MSWVKVAHTKDVKEGSAIVVEAHGRRIALCNTGEGFHAIDDLCSHDGGPLDQGKLIGNRIECPRHGAQFDVRTGKALTLPAVRPIRSYKTRVENGEVEVEV